MFDKKYIFVGVCFPGSARLYSYRTNDGSIRAGDIVIVPTPEGEKAAVAASVGRYREKDAPYPPDQAKFVIRRADRYDRRSLKGTDMQTELDISTKKVKTFRGEAWVVTGKEERKALRESYAKRPELKLTEKYPVSRECRVVARDDRGKRKRTAVLKRKEHLWGAVTYECGRCHAVLRRREAFCPHCCAEFTKTKNDPVWVDEMADYDGE